MTRRRRRIPFEVGENRLRRISVVPRLRGISRLLAASGAAVALVLASATTAAAANQTAAKKAPHGDPCRAAAVACVSLSKQEAWFARDGRILRGPVRVATGRAGYGTQVGTFSVFRKNRMWYSTLYGNAPMPYSVFFDGGEAFHEGSIRVRSHGCVHLSPSDAAWVYDFLRIGDEVQVVF